MYLQILEQKNFNIIIKADDEKLISVSATNLKSLQGKPNDITKEAFWQLNNYFQGKKYDFSMLKLDLNSFSPFRQKVLNALKNIPYASTISYKELALNIDSKAYRAVGTALSKNPYLIILPCHRVIRSDASLGRFSCDVGGMKEFLNKHEQKHKDLKFP